MGNYTELYYHLVWATRGRQEYLIGDTEQTVFDFVRNKCADLKATAYAVNGMPDHIHVVCTIPPSLAIATFIERIKGSSSHFVNEQAAQNKLLSQCLYWQTGYGAITFSHRDMDSVVAYVENQKIRHKSGRLSPRMEETESPPR